MEGLVVFAVLLCVAMGAGFALGYCYYKYLD